MIHFSQFIVILLNISRKDSAYLDPGSGSFIIQLIIASLVGIGFVVRGYWSKITGFFRGDSSEGEDEGDDELNDA